MFYYGTSILPELTPVSEYIINDTTTCREILSVQMARIATDTKRKYVFFYQNYDETSKRDEDIINKRSIFLRTFLGPDNFYNEGVFFFATKNMNLSAPTISIISLLEKYNKFGLISNTIARDMFGYTLTKMLNEYNELFLYIQSLPFGHPQDPYFAALYLFEILTGGKQTNLENTSYYNGCAVFMRKNLLQFSLKKTGLFYRTYGNNYAKNKGYTYLGESFRFCALLGKEKDEKILYPYTSMEDN